MKEAWHVGWVVPSNRMDGQKVLTITREIPGGGGEAIAECLESEVGKITAVPDLINSLAAVCDDSRLVQNINTGESYYPVSVSEMSDMRRALAKTRRATA